jgi:hypothetical protein
MGVTIDGWVEVQTPPCVIHPTAERGDWRAVVRVGGLLIQHTDAFDSLFGIARLGAFVPIAPDRGVPDDCSDEVALYRTLQPPWPTFFSHPTWVTWTELQAIDWDEMTGDGRTVVRRYQRAADGQLIAAPSPIFDDYYAQHFEPIAAASAPSK